MFSRVRPRNSSTSIFDARFEDLDAPKRTFFLALAGILLALAAADRLVAHLARNTVPRWTMGRVRQARGAQAVALGNSLIGVGFKEPEFDAGMELPKGSGSIN